MNGRIIATFESWETGYRDGLASWRARGRHAVPADHPPGSTPEGSAWFIGCIEGLQEAEALASRPMIPTDTP